jgi:putative colanic acid biosynthesis UDP-glucose lipid carrier transferase
VYLYAFVVWGFGLVTGLVIVRMFLRVIIRVARSKGWLQRRILLFGFSQSTADLVQYVEDHPEYGLDIVGYADDREQPRNAEDTKLLRLGSMNDLIAITQQHDITQVWITLPPNAEDRVKELVDKLHFETVSVRYVVELPMMVAGQGSLTMLGDTPMVDVSVSPMDGIASRLLKEVEDKTVALLALLLLSPVMLAIAVGVKLSSPGPVFFRQVRISWNNEPFEMLKFRSMPVDVEKKTGPQWAKPGENRATPFGSFLRKTSLDELPQLINVLKGDMSIVGPRPERPEFVNQFKNEIPDYMKKHQVKAGITGWAQVNGFRGDTDLKKRIEYDIFYIRNWTPLFDLQIALLTFYKGFINKNAY